MVTPPINNISPLEDDFFWYAVYNPFFFGDMLILLNLQEGELVVNVGGLVLCERKLWFGGLLRIVN